MTDLELTVALMDRAIQVQRLTGCPFLTAMDTVLEICLDTGTDWLPDPDWKLALSPFLDIR